MEDLQACGSSPGDRFEREYQYALKNADSAYVVQRAPRDDSGSHPESYRHVECAFAADMLASTGAKSVLDIGSYREFVLGLLAGYDVCTLDIRKRKVVAARERQVIGDARQLDIESDSFDAIVSLCALEHFGLGRYGDALDLEGDVRAMQEMRRVLKPGGHLIFTTTVTGAEPVLMFNAHRIYSYDKIASFQAGMDVVEERFYSTETWRFCSLDQLSGKRGHWDMYLGAWRKC